MLKEEQNFSEHIFTRIRNNVAELERIHRGDRIRQESVRGIFERREEYMDDMGLSPSDCPWIGI